ncbi:MAG: NAD(P)H-binding protein [Desulfuromonadaceae bacterium]|nr:NAD(P)H-binding protein [Desulfuromonadaceae bacterium]
MKLAVIGATGNVGSRVVSEALRRGHAVTAIARNPEKKLKAQPGLTLRAADVMDLPALTGVLAPHEAVVSAYNVGHDPGVDANPYKAIVEATRVMIAAAKQARLKQFLYVGGCGSLYVAPGVQLVDDGQAMRKMLDSAPAELKEWFTKATNLSLSSEEDYRRFIEDHLKVVPQAARIAWLLFEHDTGFNWTFLSPAANLMPGERTGRYVLGGEELLMEDGVPAGISIEDLAVAIVDELENPRHLRRHWTVKAAKA